MLQTPHPPSFHSHERLIVFPESQRQIDYLKEQLIIKERELLQRDEKLMKNKLKKQKKKIICHQEQAVEAKITEIQEKLPKHDLNLMIEKNQLPNSVVIFKENISDLEVLEKTIESKNEALRVLQEKIAEIEKNSLKLRDEIENSHKAHIIILENEWKIRETDFVREKEDLQFKVKELTEKILWSEFYTLRLKEKKKNLKHFYHESIKVNKELERTLEEKKVDFEVETKELKTKIDELVEEIKLQIKEKDQLWSELMMEKREKALLKDQIQGFMEKIKQIQSDKNFSLQTMGDYFDNLNETLIKFLSKTEKKDKNHVCTPLLMPQIQIPQIVPQVAMPMCQYQAPCCYSSCKFFDEKKTEKAQLEKMFKKIQGRYLNIHNEVSKRENPCKVEICFITDAETRNSHEFKSFLLSFRESDLKHNAETRVAFLTIGDLGVSGKDFDYLESYEEGNFAKNPIKSLNELHWRIKSLKYIVVVGSAEKNQISDFLNSEREFFMKYRPRIYLFGVKITENREVFSRETESFRWEDLVHLAFILRESVLKFSIAVHS